MRTLLAFACLAGSLLAADARNVDLRHTDFHFTMPKYGSLPEWEARKAQLRRQILVAAGLYPLHEKMPLKPLISGRIEREGYSIEKVALETMPGYYLGGNLYRPLHPKGKVPAILTPHGHWTYGRLENSEGYSGQALGINLALQGYVAFGYDMVGYNDTLQTEHRFTSPTYQLWSFTPLGLQLWNSIRALDFVESLPEVDGHRLAVTGASGGGTQTFLLAAVDDRVHAAAPVNMVSFIMQGGCPCENAPGLRVGTSNVEIAAMMAPRPMCWSPQQATGRIMCHARNIRQFVQFMIFTRNQQRFRPKGVGALYVRRRNPRVPGETFQLGPSNRENAFGPIR